MVIKHEKYNLSMIISGGQTGADRAALDFALSVGMACSGWCPKGRLSEDKYVPLRYPLIEANSNLYQHRTRLNVRDSCATLIFLSEKSSGGTILTIRCCIAQRKPHFIFSIGNDGQVDSEEKLKAWLYKTSPKVLNVAGPRASESRNIYDFVFRVLSSVLAVSERSEEPIWPPQRPKTRNLNFK